jgi:hypothetical protein
LIRQIPQFQVVSGDRLRIMYLFRYCWTTETRRHFFPSLDLHIAGHAWAR